MANLLPKLDKLNLKQLQAWAKAKGIALSPNCTATQARAELRAYYLTYLENALEGRIKGWLLATYWVGSKRQIAKVPSDTIVNTLAGQVGFPVRDSTPFDENALEFDFAWPTYKIAIEVQGGIDMPGRRTGHVSREGMRRDMYKLNLAQSKGWILFYFPPEVCTKAAAWETYGKLMLKQAFTLRLVEQQRHG